MNTEIGEVSPSAIEEEGTVMDFVDDELIFAIKNEVWMDEECQAMKHSPLTPDFVHKYDIAAFLLTLEGAVDTNDSIFNVHDSEYPEHLYRSFENDNGYGMTPYLISSINTVCTERRVRLSQGMSNMISQYFAKQRQVPFVEEEFLCNLQGLQSTRKLFEIQEMALGSETSK